MLACGAAADCGAENARLREGMIEQRGMIGMRGRVFAERAT